MSDWNVLRRAVEASKIGIDTDIVMAAFSGGYEKIEEFGRYTNEKFNEEDNAATLQLYKALTRMSERRRNWLFFGLFENFDEDINKLQRRARSTDSLPNIDPRSWLHHLVCHHIIEPLAKYDICTDAKRSTPLHHILDAFYRHTDVRKLANVSSTPQAITTLRRFNTSPE